MFQSLNVVITKLKFFIIFKNSGHLKYTISGSKQYFKAMVEVVQSELFEISNNHPIYFNLDSSKESE